MTGNNQSNQALNRKLAIKLSLGVSALFALAMYAGIFRGKIFDTGGVNIIGLVVISFITGFLSLYLQYEFCFLIFRKKWKNRKKHLAAFFGTLAVAMLISSIISIFFLLFYQPQTEHLLIHENHFHPVFDNPQFILIFLNIWRNMWYAVIVFLSTLIISSYIRNQQTLLENQRLVAENIRNRYEALKNQLNPHFLFNSLNTLDGLMDHDIDKAHSYLQNLSSTFRYTIQNKEITSLKEELDFVESYTYLMKIRYGDKLSIQYAVDEKYNPYCIMPVTLQLLMENAIKHNVINNKHPLTIRIETTEKDTIKVSNRIQPKNDAEAGEGIGLANLVERYHLLFGMDVIITKNDIFTVEIPLIKSHESRNC